MKNSLKFFLQLLLLLPLAAGAQTVSTLVPGNSGIDDNLLLDSAGNIYGSGYDNGNIYKITPAGAVSLYSNAFASANGTTWDGMGNLVVCDNTGGSQGIYKIAPDTSLSQFLATSSPSGLTKDPISDTLFFTTYTGHSIYKVAPDTTLSLLTQGSGLNGPVGMAWDDSNNLLIANFSNGIVFRIDRSGNKTQIGQFPNGIIGFIAYQNGYIYGTSFNGHKIFRMDSLGNSTLVAGSVIGQVDGPAATARFSRPNGIVFSKGGDSLYISDYGAKSIRIITGLDSVGIVANALPVLLPADIEVAPNPSEGRIRVGFYLNEAETVRMQMIDLQGREVLGLHAQNFPAGAHSQLIQAEHLPKGIYLLELQAGDTRSVRKVILQ
jgi:sugar lactone lactonase YvrE